MTKGEPLVHKSRFEYGDMDVRSVSPLFFRLQAGIYSFVDGVLGSLAYGTDNGCFGCWTWLLERPTKARHQGD